jgi:hypothetical protein
MSAVERIRSLIGKTATPSNVRLRVVDDRIDVKFSSGRSQRVAVTEDATHLLLESVAAPRVEDRVRSAALDELVLRHNHALGIVGLRRRRGALCAFVKVLKETLDPNEALHAIVAVAREADRLEELVTGRDVE